MFAELAAEVAAVVVNILADSELVLIGKAFAHQVFQHCFLLFLEPMSAQVQSNFRQEVPELSIAVKLIKNSLRILRESILSKLHLL